MKRVLLFTVILTLFIGLLFLGSQPSQAGGQNRSTDPAESPAAEDQQASNASSEDETSDKLVIGSSRKSGAEGLDEEETNPDLPKGHQGDVNENAYLRLRAEHIARLRGIEPGRPFDPGARGRAIRQMEEVQAERAARAKDSFFNKLSSAFGSETPLASVWAELGPRPLSNGSAQTGIVPVTGRVTSIAVDPTNSNKVYLGTAQGGVWRSLDAGATWTPIFDSAQTLAIGAIAIAPSSPSTLYVGTGEFNGCGDCFFGVGLYRIDNADTSANLVGPINPTQAIGGYTYKVFNGRSISKIIVHPNDVNTIFVATARGVGGSGGNALGATPELGGNVAPRGLFRSTNAAGPQGSVTFQKLAVTTDNSLPGESPATGNADTPDMVMEPGNPNNLVVTTVGLLGGGGIYRSTNALAGTPTFTPAFSFGNGIRANLAINKVGGVVTVYAATSETPTVSSGCGGSGGAVRKSIDGGANWSSQLAGGQGFCGGQCFYDSPIAVDPNDANIVYIGGNARGTCSDAMKKSENGGTTFLRDDNGLHADSHSLVFDGVGNIYTGNDGGVWKRAASGAASTAWTNLNLSPLGTLQFESLAVHPLDQFFTIGGTQDNGTQAQQAFSGNWKNAEGGDGGYTLIDQSTTNLSNVTMYLTFFNQSNSQIMFDRATLTTCLNVRNSWPTRGAAACGPTTICPDDSTPASSCDNLPFFRNNGIQLTDNVLFYAPMALGPGNPNTLYFGTDRLYRSTDRGDNMTIVSQSPLQPTGSRTPLGGGTDQTTGTPISTIGISPQDDNYRIIGMQNGRVWATSTGSSAMFDITSGSFPANPNGSPTNKFVGRVIFDPNNKNVAYLSFSFYAPAGQGLWKITNVGAAGSGSAPNWIAAGAGIPSIPINALAIDPTNSNNIFAGTDIGVYNSTDGGATWNPFGVGLPRVAVFSMAIQPSSRILRVATHGRGMWQIGLDAAGGPNTVQFSSSGQTTTETLNQTTKVNITVTRAGDLSGPATINYSTQDGTASERSDYEAAIGTLHFAANEGTKTISVFIVDDRFGEGPETFSVNLSNPVGCSLGSPASFTVTINSDETVNGVNPVRDATFDTDFFVRQHYIDFLNRVPDDGGLAFWKNEIDSCTTQACREIKRINVSGAFFLSIEFQQTGYLVERLYKTAYGNNNSAISTLGGTPHQISVPIIRLNEFLPDTQQIGNGVVIGQPGADQLLENNKQVLIAEFVQRARFLNAYPTSMSPTDFVNALSTNAGPGVVTQSERNQLISDLTQGIKNRAEVLRAIAEDPDLVFAEKNPAFVLVQYFGYLRRNPDDSPDSGDYKGYEFWLSKLIQFNGNYVDAEMVNSFIQSIEYRARFGP